jgi:hypothetical protein
MSPIDGVQLREDLLLEIHVLGRRLHDEVDVFQLEMVVVVVVLVVVLVVVAVGVVVVVVGTQRRCRARAIVSVHDFASACSDPLESGGS